MNVLCPRIHEAKVKGGLDRLGEVWRQIWSACRDMQFNESNSHSQNC
jgi:hypothetical protein